MVEYYQESQWLYRLFCYTPRSLGMHFGFWNEDTKDRQEAIVNENREVMAACGVKKGMRALDAGCGVGGTAIFIARESGARVWGVTIDPKQVILAQKYALGRGVGGLTDFSVQDFRHTNFPGNYFDAVYGIESVCYASPKSDFLKEAFRVLRPGGRLVVADGYVARKKLDEREKKLIGDFTWAFELDELITPEEMTEAMNKTGFVKVECIDRTEQARPSVEYFQRLMRWFAPVAWVWWPVYRNWLALKLVGEAYGMGLARYCLHMGRKSK